MSKRTILFVATAAILCFIGIFLIPTKYHYEWDPRKVPTASGHQPYDMEYFDELMRRSLDKGYEVKNIGPVRGSHDDYAVNENDLWFYGVDEIFNAPLDTNILVVQHFRWRAELNDSTVGDIEDPSNWTGTLVLEDEVSAILNLLHFAQEGGTALYAEYHHYGTYGNWLLLNILELTDLRPYYSSTYDKSSLKTKSGDPKKIIIDSDSIIDADCRFADYPFDLTEYSDVTSLETKTPDSVPVIVKVMLKEADNPCCHLLDVYFPDSGGHLYFTNLAPYFSNIGLILPEGDKLIASMMSKLDDKPVKRLEYPYIRGSGSGPGYNESTILGKIEKNPALRFTWWLLLVLAATLLACGLVRRYPVAKGAAAEALDRSDAVAVREYQFKKSPLLHFLFQCSWLYNGKTDYSSLFEINFHRLSRVVNRYTEVELSQASAEEIRKAARYFSARLDRDEEEVANELMWMQGKHYQKVNPIEFAKSQKIVEKYPLQ